MSRRRVVAAALSAAVLTPVVVGCVPPVTTGSPAAWPQATGPGVAVEARGALAGLTRAPEGPAAGYSRELFPHWSTVSGSCNTRETVLAEQGTDVRVGSGCYPASGTWVSPYDGAVWHKASDVDVDHVVALQEAWTSGASGWTEQRREEFANDLGPRGDGYPQLVVVTDNVNQAKGARDPATWRPSQTSYWCTYAVQWIDVKDTWGLTADQAEVDALDDMLDTCDPGGGS